MNTQVEVATSIQDSGFFRWKPKVQWGILTFVLLAAIAIRINYLDSSRILAERQFRSAFIAREFYFESLDSVPEWRKQVVITNRQREGLLEPPIMEYVVSLLYRLIGAEHLWVARLLSVAFWIVGGTFLFSIAKRIVSIEAAIFATAYYLFVPITVDMSISFLPDPLMIMMFLLSLFTILRYYDRPSKASLVIAGGISGLAILVKPLILFAILGAFISLAISKTTSWKRIIDFNLLTFLSICFLPVAFYYLYGIFIARYLAGQAQASFLPQLLLTREYWKDWLLTAVDAVGYAPLIAALVGLPMLRPGLPRALLIGLWIGYIVFCLVFTYHIRFASHYHLQLVIIIALSFGPLVSLVTKHFAQLSNRWYWWLPLIGALLLVMLFNIRDIRSRLTTARTFESKRAAQEIGEIVNHSTQVIYVAPYYGGPLEYYGELSGVYWPRRISDTDRALGYQNERSIEERLEALDISPEYFVITDFQQFNRHHSDLKEYLANNCPLVAKSDQYIIYKACQK